MGEMKKKKNAKGVDCVGEMTRGDKTNNMRAQLTSLHTAVMSF